MAAAISKATLKEAGEQQTPKPTEKTTLKTTQNQNRTSINEATRRDIINIPPNSQQGHEKASKDEGWKTVSYKKHKNNSRQLQTRLNRAKEILATKATYSNPQIEAAFGRAFNVRLCLMCMGKDHKRAQCREPIRCFKCGLLGHTLRSCQTLYKSKGRKIPLHSASKTTQGKSYKQALTHNTKTTKMEAQSMIRPETEEVFFPFRQHLRQQNDYLHRAVVVVLLQGIPSQQVKNKIPHAIQQHLGWNNELLEATKIMTARTTPYIIICLNENNKDTMIIESPYNIPELNTEFGLIDWTPEWGMEDEPATHQAWLTISDLPLQAWNNEDIRKLLAKYGCPTHIQPYDLAADNFEDITLHLIGGHPMKIPRTLKYRENGMYAMVRITLHNWREIQHGPYPPDLNQDNGQPEEAHSMQVSQPSSHTPPPQSPSVDTCMGSTTATSKRAGRPRRRSTQYEWKPKRNVTVMWVPKRNVTAIWVPKKTQQHTATKPQKGGTEDQTQQIAFLTKFKFFFGVQEFQTVSYAMMTNDGIKLMRQDRRGIVMKQFKLRVQIERTTTINAMVAILTFFPMRQRAPLTWTASTKLQLASQAVQEDCQAISPASQYRPNLQISQMPTTQWSEDQSIQWSDRNINQGLQIEGLSQTPEDKTCQRSLITAQPDHKKAKQTDDSTQTARRSRRLMDKRSGEYKSPQERALQVCYPDSFGGHTANRSKGNSNAQFKIKDRKTPMDE
jgi:hypothetical protein